MKQFIYGSKKQFNALFERTIANGTGKKISYSVRISNTQQAKLVFRSTGNNSVRVCLVSIDGTELEFENTSLRRLTEPSGIVARDADELQSIFQNLRVNFPQGNDGANKDASAENTQIDFFSLNPEEISASMKERIVGQDEHIDGIVRSVCNHLKKPNPIKPLTIMLPGPTGVGKTATARQVAKELQKVLGVEKCPLMIVNCNELAEEYRISQLIGSPAGYVGHAEPPMMTQIQNAPTAVVVFDEYEKCHAAIHRATMNWFDTGVITLSKANDENGNMSFECPKAIFIMTSNIDMSVRGAEEEFIQSTNDKCRKIMVANGFKPEIASRISYFYEFNALTMEDYRKIMSLVFKNKALEYGVKVVNIEESIVNEMQERWQASTFGVRSLESDLDNIIGSQITKELALGGEYDIGGRLEELTFTRREGCDN